MQSKTPSIVTLTRDNVTQLCAHLIHFMQAIHREGRNENINETASCVLTDLEKRNVLVVNHIITPCK
jgi:hypothetical protein